MMLAPQPAIPRCQACSLPTALPTALPNALPAALPTGRAAYRAAHRTAYRALQRCYAASFGFSATARQFSCYPWRCWFCSLRLPYRLHRNAALQQNAHATIPARHCCCCRCWAPSPRWSALPLQPPLPRCLHCSLLYHAAQHCSLPSMLLRRSLPRSPCCPHKQPFIPRLL
jgi:hypothetical protein